MRLIHLSDLHLGKRVHEFSMLEDQKYILKEIIGILEQEKAEGVLLAGDIYDKAVPSVEAVQLLDWFLTQIAQRKIPVFLISGNHDSPERLAFGSGLMKESGIYVSKAYEGAGEPVLLRDEWGEVAIYLLPFLKPAVVRYALGREEIGSYQEAVAAAVKALEPDRTRRNVLVAHQFVTGAFRSDSEEVSAGGLDNVDVSVFDDFDYVALGHIHGPQKMGRETVRYCGTPLKYSFSEVHHQKSVTVVELGAKGEITVRTVPLTPRRDMRLIRGTYLEVTARDFYARDNREDYVQITLTDEEDIPNGLEKLRVIYPNLMRLVYDNRRTRENRLLDRTEEMERKSGLDLLEEFYLLQNNQSMCREQRAFAAQWLENRGEDVQ